MICSGVAKCGATGSVEFQSLEVMKPVKAALGLEPRPVAPSSLISPPAPVAAPAKGEMAVGWLWVSTFIKTCSSCCSPLYKGDARPGTAG